MAKFTTKDYIYITGSFASIAALGLWAWSQRNFSFAWGPTVTTDAPQTVASTPSSSPIYTNYNTGAYGAVQAGSDVAPNVENTSCCCANNDCAGTTASPLASGQTFDDFQSLMQFYTQTNPNYIQAQQNNLQQYYADFATGSVYKNGSQTVNANGVF